MEILTQRTFLVTENGTIVFLDWTYAEIGDALKNVAYLAFHVLFGSIDLLIVSMFKEKV